MEIIYARNAKLYFAIADGRVWEIQKDTASTINPHATILENMDVTFERTHVEGETLYLDGLALTDLAEWVQRQKPNASFRTFARCVSGLFPGSAFINDLARATLRCVAGLEHTAQGEDAYFCRKVREAHPVEFAEMAESWAEHHKRSLAP